MLVLAIESATDAAAVALADSSGVIALAGVEQGRRHGETIAPAIVEVCARAGVAPSDVQAVAVDVGPGLFTGLRVGVATAQAFAAALGIPVVPVGSLRILAQAAAESAAGSGRAGDDVEVVAAVDARRGEIFWARFTVAPAPPWHAHRRHEDRLSSTGALLVELGHEQTTVVGDGALRYAGQLAAAGHRVAGPMLAHPPVAVLASLGRRRLLQCRTLPPSGVVPRYLREADARINWEQRLPSRPPAAT